MLGRRDDPKQQRDILETEIVKFESDLGPALVRFAKAASLADQDDRDTLFLFMALATVKIPRHRRRLDGVIHTASGPMMKAGAANPHRRIRFEHRPLRDSFANRLPVEDTKLCLLFSNPCTEERTLLFYALQHRRAFGNDMDRVVEYRYLKEEGRERGHNARTTSGFWSGDEMRNM